MKPFSPIPWPPLITAAKLPWFVRARDFLMTCLAWIAMAWLLRLALFMIWDYFSDPIFELTRTQAPDWELLWHHFSTFVYLVLSLVIWIVSIGLIRRTQLCQIYDSKTPPVLSLDEHAARFDLEPAQVEQWRQWRITTVFFDEDRIAEARPGGTELEPADDLT